MKRKIAIAAVLFAVALVGVFFLFSSTREFELHKPDSSPVKATLIARGNLHPLRDFEGRTLRVATWYPRPIMQFAWGDEPCEETALNYHTARLMWDNARRVERDFNVNFEFVVIPWDMYMEHEPIADVMMLNSTFIINAIQNNLIVPWNRANLPDSDILGNQIYARPVVELNGRAWAINANAVDISAWGLGVNLEIIERDSLPNPVELYEAGEWTWDAMLDIMRSATREGQFGISGQPRDIIGNLIAANDGMMVNANFDYGFGHPNTVEALQFAQKIFNENLWQPLEFPANYSRSFVMLVPPPTVTMFPITAWALENTPPCFSYAFVPFPPGPANTTGNTWLAPLSQGIAMPRVGSSWEIEDALIILEELFSWAYPNSSLLIETAATDWLREIFPSEADVQRFIAASSTTEIGTDIMVNDIGYAWILDTFAAHFANHEMSAAQAIEYYRDSQQAMLDMFFER